MACHLLSCYSFGQEDFGWAAGVADSLRIRSCAKLPSRTAARVGPTHLGRSDRSALSLIEGARLCSAARLSSSAKMPVRQPVAERRAGITAPVRDSPPCHVGMSAPRHRHAKKCSGRVQRLGIESFNPHSRRRSRPATRRLRPPAFLAQSERVLSNAAHKTTFADTRFCRTRSCCAFRPPGDFIIQVQSGALRSDGREFFGAPRKRSTHL